MSDYYLRLIPMKVGFVPVRDFSREIMGILETYNIRFDDYSYIQSNKISFVDCGGELELIQCNHCNADLSDWWGEAMSESAESKFERLEIITPCCHRASRLDMINYCLPVGFASLIIELLNPRDELNEKVLDEIQELLGCELRKIMARY